MTYDPDTFRTFRPNGDAFVSHTISHITRSPVYVIASLAKMLVEAGESVELPEGYDAETLDRISLTTGSYGQDVSVSGRQADEMAAIGRQLLGRFGDRLTEADRADVVRLVQTVDPGKPIVAERVDGRPWLPDLRATRIVQRVYGPTRPKRY